MKRFDIASPPGVFAPDGAGRPAWSDAVRVGDSVWVTGQLGWDRATRRLVQGAFEAEAELAFQDLGHLLASPGATCADVVQVRADLVESTDDAAYDTPSLRFFGPNRPERATVVVAELTHHPGFDIEAVAIVRARAASPSDPKSL